ncbi:MAG: molybdenum cofactor guanylyltransferase [Desulfovibrionales bacterium]|nr:molybdenum cofactor guanylyltransferase [Desulfovibrionales bacterium]
MIGVVLAGGKSVRLGQDKTRIMHNGQSLLERAVTLLGHYCSGVYVSCRHTTTVPPAISTIVDTTQRVGPLGGIITCLKKINAPILVLACDLPFMQGYFLEKLIQARILRPKHCVLTTWQELETGFIQTLVSIYEPAALPLLEQGLIQKKYKINALIPQALRHILTYPTSENQVFFNVNRPQDLHLLQQDQA